LGWGGWWGGGGGRGSVRRAWKPSRRLLRQLPRNDRPSRSATWPSTATCEPQWSSSIPVAPAGGQHQARLRQPLRLVITIKDRRSTLARLSDPFGRYSTPSGLALTTTRLYNDKSRPPPRPSMRTARWPRSHSACERAAASAGHGRTDHPLDAASGQHAADGDCGSDRRLGECIEHHVGEESASGETRSSSRPHHERPCIPWNSTARFCNSNFQAE